MRFFLSIQFFVCLTILQKGRSQCSSNEDHLELKFLGDGVTPVFNVSAVATKVDTVRLGILFPP